MKLSHRTGPTVATEMLEKPRGEKVTKVQQVKPWNMKEGSENSNRREGKSEN